jgi:hypothetical protein
MKSVLVAPLHSAALALLSLFVLAGCGAEAAGPARAAVSGTVTFGGEPVEDGTITFIPTGSTQGPSAAEKIVGGKYEFKASQGVVVGRNRVEIRGLRKTGKQVETGPPAPPGTKVDVVESYIPKQFNEQSELVKEIAAGKNENVDFPLKKP